MRQAVLDETLTRGERVYQALNDPEGYNELVKSEIQATLDRNRANLRAEWALEWNSNRWWSRIIRRR